MNKELRTATLRELESWPDVTMTEESGKKHDKVILHYRGETRFVVVANTPSDVRAVPNHITALRKEIRALGAERAHIITGKPKEPAPVQQTCRKEKTMPKENNLEAIFKSIGELRYSEMLKLAGFLSEVATGTNLRRGRKESWAQMLQTAVDVSQEADRPLNEPA